jgi:hypothetical protein
MAQHIDVDKTFNEYYGISCLSTIPFSPPFHRLPRSSKLATSSIQRESLSSHILPTPFLLTKQFPSHLLIHNIKAPSFPPTSLPACLPNHLIYQNTKASAHLVSLPHYPSPIITPSFRTASTPRYIPLSIGLAYRA